MGILNETFEVYLNIPQEQKGLFMDVFRDVKSALTDHLGKQSVHRYCNTNLKCDCLWWTSSLLSAEHFRLFFELAE